MSAVSPKTDVNGTRMDTEFGSIPIRFSLGGLFGLNSKFCVRTRPTGPHPLRARELTTPHPEGLTTRLVPVEVDLKQQIFDVALPSTTDIDLPPRKWTGLSCF